MSLRYKGAVISATPPTTTGGESGVASGSWTLEQQFQAQGAGNWPIPFVAKYIEDVFSTYLYTGNGSTQTITNGINLSTNGGLVWAKMRSNGSATGHVLSDTARGPSQKLDTSSTGASSNWTPYGISAFGSTGFTVADDGAGNYVTNNSGVNYVSWTFRKQAKFFDVVTYTGNGGTPQNISHSLGSVPGFIVVKPTSTTGGWICYHRSLTASGYNPAPYNTINLNSTGSIMEDTGAWNSTAPTSTVFTIGSSPNVNTNGATYVAYLFAHNAGGFGLTGTDNVISCGSYTGNGSTTGPVVDLGYEPQWLLVKRASASGDDWILVDNMRGFPVTGNTQYLNPNNSFSESSFALVSPLATGFQPRTTDGGYNGNGSTYIYIAIRRGPMKVPTSGTSVFQPIIDTGDTIETSTATFPLDMQFNTLYNVSNATYNNQINDRLRGIGFAPSFTTTPHLTTASTAAETTSSSYLAFKGNGMDVTKDTGWGGTSAVFYNFRRATSFFDEVCYTGTGSARTQAHNLGVVPELMIVKSRTNATNWQVYSDFTASSYSRLFLNTTASATTGIGYNAGTNFTAQPTATSLFLDFAYPNSTGETYVAYLFATCAGVSKVGSYTGNGSTQTINCGFTGGARFVLIKRTNTSGSWFVWDTARGMVSGTDPALTLNTANAEYNADSIYTATGGFQILASPAEAINNNGDTYIYLAIA